MVWYCGSGVVVVVKVGVVAVVGVLTFLLP